MRRLRKVLAALATVTCLAIISAPSAALADDIEVLDDDVVVTFPQQQTGSLPRRAPARAQSSPTGKWVEVKRSEGGTAIQTCAYYIHPDANPRGDRSGRHQNRDLLQERQRLVDNDEDYL